MEVAAQHRRKRWPNEAKWRRGIDKRAAQMDGMGAWHRWNRWPKRLVW
jgi:hypothetical protein